MNQINKQTRRIIVAGQQNVGKSTFALTQVVARIPLKRKYVIEPDGMNPLYSEFKISDPYEDMNTDGQLRFIYDEDDPKFLRQIGNARNSLLIFDDCALMLSDPYRVAQFCKIFARSRQSGNFIVFVIHSLSGVPKAVWNYATDLIIFKMKDNPKQGQYKIVDFERVEKAYNDVMKAPEPRAFAWINLV